MRSTGRLWAGLALSIFIASLLALSIAGCRQSAIAEPDPTPTTAIPQPTMAPAELAPPLPARLPDPSTLPSFVNLELVGSGEATDSSQHPAYLMAELSGREISSVSLMGGSVLEDGRRRVFFYQPIDPDPTDDEWPGLWADGVHDLVQSWDFMGDYLWDGQQGDFAVLWTTDPDADTRTVHGRYRAAGSDAFQDAVLVVNTDLGRAEEVVKTGTGEEVSFVAGDEFELSALMLDEEGSLSSEPKTVLSFTEGGHLAFTRRPAPSGAYFLGVSAESAGGEADAVYANFQVNNDSLLAGYRAYLDAERGFQLLYPETWPKPSEQGGRLLFTDPAGTTQISVSAHPDMAGQPIGNLKQQALAAYGAVSVLYEDQVEVGSSGGLRTVYGYSGPDGPRTGVLLTFSHQGMAYVIDLDGPSSEEESLLEVAGVIAAGWTGREVVASGGGNWTAADVDGLAVQVPADHHPQQMANGWQRFGGADELTFLAMRSEPADGRGLFNGLAHWQDVAASNVLDFAASEIYAQERGVRSWARVDFEYELDVGQRIGGAIMLTRIGDRFLILWSEAPLAQFPAYEAQVLATVVDDLSRERGDGVKGG